jgi:hypothetical protein
MTYYQTLTCFNSSDFRLFRFACINALRSSYLLVCLFTLCVACNDDEANSSSELGGTQSSTAGTSNAIAGNNTANQLPSTNENLYVSTPISGQIFTQTMITVSGTHSAASSVLVQGIEVPVVNQRFSTILTLEEGIHRISIDSVGHSEQASIDIMVDLTAPTVNIIDPTYGSHIDTNQNSSITLVAQAQDALSGIKVVKVNQTEAIVNDRGMFQFPYMPTIGLNRINIEVIDHAGHSIQRARSFIYGRFKTWESSLGRSALAWITPFAFNTLEDSLEVAINNGLIDDLIANAGESQGVTIEDIRYRRFNVDVEPQQGHLKVTIQFDLLRVLFSVEQPETMGDVFINPAVLSTKVYITPTANGMIDVQVQDTEIELNSFQVNIDNDLIDTIFIVIESFVKDFIEDALREVINSLLIDQLIDDRLFTPTLSFFDRLLQLKIVAQDVVIDPAESIVRAGIAVIDENIFNFAPGYLYQDTAGEITSLPNMLSFGIHLNLLNMLTAHLWRSGFMNLSLAEILNDQPDALKASLMSTFTKDQALLEYMQPEDFVGVVLRPQLPPVIKFNTARTDIVTVQVDDVLVDLTLPDSRPWLTLHLNVNITLSPKIVNSELQLGLSLDVNAWPENEPLFKVDGERLLDVLTPIIESIPQLLGTEGVNNILDISQTDLFELRLDSAQVQTIMTPHQVLKLGLQVTVP